MRILVIGQGLAGTLASHFGLRKGWDVHVIDAGLPSASSVAAGMFNPMSFRRIIEAWEAEAHLRIMRQKFMELESITGSKLLFEMPIYKRLANSDYAALWKDKSTQLPWLNAPDAHWPAEGIVEGGGWVNLPLLLHLWRDRLNAEQRFELRGFQNQDAENLKNGHWDAIVDCRGTSAGIDGTLPLLDIRPYRGELLTLQHQGDGETPPHAHILNFGKWTIPLGQNQWRLGASYEWNQTDLEPSTETQQYLLDALHAAVPNMGAMTVTEHQVGLRPVSRDRRPAVGPYPGVPGWYVLNGLGTRGVLIGPRWALHLVDIIDGEASLTPETKPDRLLFDKP